MCADPRRVFRAEESCDCWDGVDCPPGSLGGDAGEGEAKTKRGRKISNEKAIRGQPHPPEVPPVSRQVELVKRGVPELKLNQLKKW